MTYKTPEAMAEAKRIREEVEKQSPEDWGADRPESHHEYWVPKLLALAEEYTAALLETKAGKIFGPKMDETLGEGSLTRSAMVILARHIFKYLSQTEHGMDLLMREVGLWRRLLLEAQLEAQLTDEVFQNLPTDGKTH